MGRDGSVRSAVASRGVSRVPESLVTAIIGQSVSGRLTRGVGDTANANELSAAVVNAQQAQAEALGIALTGLLTAQAQQERLQALGSLLNPVQ